MGLLSCFRPPREKALAPEVQQQSLIVEQPAASASCATVQQQAGLPMSLSASGSALHEACAEACADLLSCSNSDTWSSRIRSALSAVKRGLATSHCRLLVFDSRGAAWPFLPLGAPPGVACPSCTVLHHLLTGNPGSLPFMRAEAMAAVVTAIAGGEEPIPVLEARPLDQPLTLQPGDLIALPVVQEGRVIAALMVGWGSAQLPPAGVGMSEPGSDGSLSAKVLSPADLAELTRLVRFLAYGLLGEQTQAKYLTQVCDRLLRMSAAASMQDLVHEALEAAAEALHTKFALRLHPVMAVVHGGSTPTVFFAQRTCGLDALRQPGSDAGPSSLGLSGAAQPASSYLPSRNIGAEKNAGPSSGAPSVLDSVMVGNTSPDVPCVRAVKSSLAQTLLAQTLRSAPPRPAAAGDDEDASRSQSLLHTSIVPDASAHLMEEHQPCRDILLCTNLTGARACAVVMLTEGVVPENKMAAQTASGIVTCSVNSGGAGPVSAMTIGGAADAIAARNCTVADSPSAFSLDVARACDAVSVTPPFQLAMYAAAAEPLPLGLLELVAAELRALLPLVFTALRGALSTPLANGSRLSAEWRHMQAQLGVTPPVTQQLSPAWLSPSQSVTAGGNHGSDMLSGLRAQSHGTAHPASMGLGLDLVSPPLGRSLSHAACMGQGPNSINRRTSAATASQQAKLAASPARGASAGGTQVSVQGSRPCSSQMPGAVLPASPSLLVQLGVAQQPLQDAMNTGPAERTLDSAPSVVLEPQPEAYPQELMVARLRSRLTSVATDTDNSSPTRAAVAQDLAAVQLLEVLGRGGQGVVFRGSLHGLEAAVKVLTEAASAKEGADGTPPPQQQQEDASPQQDVSPFAFVTDHAAEAHVRQAKRGAMEVAATATLSHPNIVQVYAAFNDVVIVRCHYKDSQAPEIRLCAPGDKLLQGKPHGPLNQVLCLEYCDAGTLMAAASTGAFRNRSLSASDGSYRHSLVPLYTSLLEVALALRYLHARRLVHCDVKASNVLLKSSSRDPRGWTCKLSDFGCVRMLTEAGSDGLTPIGFRTAMAVGTVAYMPPECFIKDSLLTPAVDIYAFGILMWELLTCGVPYYGFNPKDVPRQVVGAGLRPMFPANTPIDYHTLAARCWSGRPARRPSAITLVACLEQLLTAAKAAEAAETQP